MASIVIKPQLCGKNNCRCVKEGRLHGGYYWLVTYMRKTEFSKGKYNWQYLGKTAQIAIEKLQKINPDLLDQKKIRQKLETNNEVAMDPLKDLRLSIFE